jgi:dephospho-CoA kinase
LSSSIFSEDQLIKEINRKKKEKGVALIGAIGPSASGKTSVVCTYLKEQGYGVLTIDEATTDYYKDIEPKLKEKFIEKFGSDTYKPDGRLNREYFWSRPESFRDMQFFSRQVSRPHMLGLLLKMIEQTDKALVFYDAASVEEVGFEEVTDWTWYVNSGDTKDRKERFIARVRKSSGMADKFLEGLWQATLLIQPSDEEYARSSTETVRILLSGNDNSENHSKVKKLLSKYLERVKNKTSSSVIDEVGGIDMSMDCVNKRIDDKFEFYDVDLPFKKEAFAGFAAEIGDFSDYK